MKEFSIGLPRQTPRLLIYKGSTHAGALIWGLDTGLAFTTFRVSAATWAALALAATQSAPLLTGAAYGTGFALPLACAILLPKWRQEANGGDRIEPQWLLKFLRQYTRSVQVAGVVIMAVTAIVLVIAEAKRG